VHLAPCIDRLAVLHLCVSLCVVFFVPSSWPWPWTHTHTHTHTHAHTHTHIAAGLTSSHRIDCSWIIRTFTIYVFTFKLYYLLYIIYYILYLHLCVSLSLQKTNEQEQTWSYCFIVSNCSNCFCFLDLKTFFLLLRKPI